MPKNPIRIQIGGFNSGRCASDLVDPAASKFSVSVSEKSHHVGGASEALVGHCHIQVSVSIQVSHSDRNRHGAKRIAGGKLEAAFAISEKDR
jgi:hypothetical protein